MSKTTARHKKLSLRFKWALSLVVVFLLLVFGCLIYYARKIEPLVAERIKETIENSTDSLYSISFSEIRINPISGNVRLKNIQFKAHPDVYQKQKQQGFNPTHLYDISVKSLVLKKAHPIKAYFKKDLEIKELIIDHPVIRVYYQHPRKETAEPPDKRTAWQRLKKYLNSVKIKEIALNNIDFRYIDESLGKPEIDGVKNLSVKIKGLLIDSLSQYDKSRFYFTKDILVQVRDHEYLTKDHKYKVLLKELNISSSRKSANVKGLQLIPLFQEIQYIPDFSANRVRYNFNLGSLHLNNINIQRLIDRRELRASSLIVSDSDVEIFLNRLLPKKEFDRGINFPHVALKRLRLNTSIDTVTLRNSAITYREYNPLTERTGKFFINSINGKVLNLTNDSLLLRKNQWIKLHFSSRIYGKAKLDLNLNFDLLSPVEAFNYSGTISDLNARYFNSISKPLALMKVNSGLIREAKFSVDANYRNARGKLKMQYQGLNIGLLKIDENKVLHRQMLLSMVANNLLIKEDNPTKGELIRTGTISYSRPDSVAFFGMIWKSLYSGIKETIGLTHEREQELKKKFEGLNQGNTKGKRREARRAKREIRRETENRSSR